MPPIRSGIPTTYSNTNFRSRLEARWAAFFDLIGWRWVYEPLDAGGYIPDFLIQGRHPFFVEVGPCVTQADYEAKAVKANVHAEILKQDLLVVGVSPLPDLEIHGSGLLACGWLGEYGLFPTEGSFGWDVGVWGGHPDFALPRGCSIGIYHSILSYSHRPFSDDHEHPLTNADRHPLEHMWAVASNETQWLP
jgi:hypothetical protein